MKKTGFLLLVSSLFFILSSCDDEDKFSFKKLFGKKTEPVPVEQEMEETEVETPKEYFIGTYRDNNPDDTVYSSIPEHFSFTASPDFLLAQPEILAEIPCGSGEKELSYEQYRDEGINIPKGPAVTKTGKLVFYYSYHSPYIYNYDDGKWTVEKIKNEYLYTKEKYYICSNQNGFKNAQNKRYFNLMKIDFEALGQTIDESDNVYDVPYGIYVERYENNSLKTAFGYDFTDIRNVQFVPQENLDAWLKTQDDDFSFTGGRLYKGGSAWSTNFNGKLIGKLKSGHSIYKDSKKLYFVNSNNQCEKTLVLNWEKEDENQLTDFCYDTWSLGPWGEIYCLIGPEQKYETSADNLPVKSELTVIRNHLKHFGLTLSDNSILYSNADIASKVVKSCTKNTGFAITGYEETFDRLFVKVRLLDGTTGYFDSEEIRDLYEGPYTKLPWPNKSEWNYILSENATDAKYFTYNDIEDQKGCVIITKISRDIPKEVIIPSEINGKKVTAIMDKCFMESQIESVIVPATIKEIPSMAFYNCKKLKTVKLGTSVVKLGSKAFSECTSLQTITFSSKLEMIGPECFLNCTALKQINLEKINSKKPLTIETLAFNNCTNLTKVLLNDNVSISENAFMECPALDEETQTAIKAKIYYHD
ncbi:MAG: leucine-rich repeat domain-containing protein [Treponema sp.]|nr:leucine-rich repeat domain-containing protein [Treponema sp.]